MTEKEHNHQGFEITERICAAVKTGEKYAIIKAVCSKTNETVWVTGDDRVCAVTREDFLRNKLPYNSVLIQEIHLEDHTPESVGRWQPLIKDFVETMLKLYMKYDGLVHVYPWWVPEEVYAHLGKDIFDQMCVGCDHIILYAEPQGMDFVPKK